MKRIFKKSLSKKIFFIFSVLILFFVLLLYFLNTVYLEKYYINKRMEKLSQIIVLKDFEDKDIFQEKVNEYQKKYSIKIDLLSLHPSGYFEDHQTIMNYMILEIISKDEMIKIKNNGIVKKLYYNDMTKQPEIAIIRLYDNINILVITTSISSIKEAVEVINDFNISVGLLIIVISIIFIFIFSSRLNKPLERLKFVAKRLAELKFDEKYNIKTGDEIEEVGETFNYLSRELEININMIKNLSEQYKLEVEKEKELKQNIKDFISNVSHELKTPIALVRAYAEGLKDNIENNEDRDYYCDIIINENIKMDKLVKNLLELTKLQSKKLNLSMQEFDLNILNKKIIMKFEKDFRDKNINVLNNVLKTVRMRADKFKIEQVITNFLTNAINFSEKNGKIVVDLKVLNDKKYFFIRNKGKIIDKNNLEKIWEPFYKTDKSRNRKYGGTGLGLSIVKEILENHNFDYGVNNIEEYDFKGVEFYFEIK